MSGLDFPYRLQHQRNAQRVTRATRLGHCPSVLVNVAVEAVFTLRCDLLALFGAFLARCAHVHALAVLWKFVAFLFAGQTRLHDILGECGRIGRIDRGQCLKSAAGGDYVKGSLGALAAAPNVVMNSRLSMRALPFQ